MPWISWIDEDEAEGRLASSFERLKNSRGKMDHILKIHSLNPPSLETHYDYYRSIQYGPSGLSRAQREMMAVVVSWANRCRY